MMQNSFHFEVQNPENLVAKSFLSFIESDAFENLLVFAVANSTFVSLSFTEDIFSEICSQVKKSYGLIDRRSKPKASRQYSFCNLNSFFTGKEEDEIKFLDLIKSRLPEEKFIGIFTKDGISPFKLYDLKTRFDASVTLDYKFQGNLDFIGFAKYFFQKNALIVSDEILNLMLLNTERTLPSFAIFLEELKHFIEETKETPNRQNFRQILLRYEQKKNI